MYEYMSGLGWETIFETNWMGGRTERPKTCSELSHRGVAPADAQQRCIKETVSERSLATAAQCVRMGWACETEGDSGSTWCCPPGQPDRQIVEGEVIPGDPTVDYVPPSGGDPSPVSQHTFLSNLSHPGALVALGLFGAVAYFGYRGFVATEGTEAYDV